MKERPSDLRLLRPESLHVAVSDEGAIRVPLDHGRHLLLTPREAARLSADLDIAAQDGQRKLDEARRARRRR